MQFTAYGLKEAWRLLQEGVLMEKSTAADIQTQIRLYRVLLVFELCFDPLDKGRDI